jgi:hypothetical protein
MIGLPFRIMPFVWTAAISASLIGLFWIVDEIGDRREAKVVARYVERDAEAAEKARRDADAAEDARLPAALPGSIARLRAQFCRDCQEATDAR